MSIYKAQLNTFLVEVFNDILRFEEANLSTLELNNLTISEIHVIDAIYEGMQDGTNTMAEIANRLMITASTLTTSVKTLEQKGYLVRTKGQSDKRRVMVTPTPQSEKPYQHHKQFHINLVNSVSQNLNEEEIASLTQALSKLHQFFKTIKTNE